MRWYAIQYLHVDDVPVMFRVGNIVVKGLMKIGARGGYQYWVEDGPKNMRRLPKGARPWCWRPEQVADWPERLPRTTINEELPDDVEEDELEDESDHIDKILSPDFRLGQPHERPESRAEAETRFLRFLLTDRFMERISPAIRRARTTAGDWPREFVVGAKLVEQRLRMSRDGKLPGWRDEDYQDVHVDMSDLEARSAQWEPTRRDIGDWEQDAPRWGRSLNKLELKIVKLRCARWSYRGISQRTPLSYEAIRQKYNKAIDKIWRASKHD